MELGQLSDSRVARLSLERVWLRETRGKMERFSVESCVGGYHVYKARTPLVLAYLNQRYWSRSCLLPCSLLCSLPPSPHVGQLEKGNPTDQGHCQQGTSSEKEPNVSTWEGLSVLHVVCPRVTPRGVPGEGLSVLHVVCPLVTPRGEDSLRHQVFRLFSGTLTSYCLIFNSPALFHYFPFVPNIFHAVIIFGCTHIVREFPVYPFRIIDCLISLFRLVAFVQVTLKILID